MIGAFLGLEGAHALDIDSPASRRAIEHVVRQWFAAGYRVIGLVHFFDNVVGGSAHGKNQGGLTRFGRDLVEELGELHLVVDLAHASPSLMDDVLRSSVAS